MMLIGQPERATQNRVVALFRDELGYRTQLYKGTVVLVRAYANISDELDRAGYSGAEAGRIKERLAHYLDLREIIRKASGETLDLKTYWSTCWSRPITPASLR